MSHLTIVLLVTLFMMVMFIWHKVPFGVTAMTCCLILAATGVVDLKSAFIGFGNKTVVLIAPILALSSVLTKTALVDKISGTLNMVQGKSGMMLIIAFYAVAALFSQFVPSTAALAILVVFLTTLKKGAVVEKLPQAKQMIVYIVFTVVMLCLIFNQITKNWMYLAPAAGVIILIFTGCIDAKDASKDMTQDMIWMLAGVLIVADAIGSSGAGEVIGQFILNIIGQNPSQFKVMLIFSAATVIMTTFISNMGTQSVLIPIAASVALAAGWDPRGLVLIIGTANYFAVGFPSGSGECAVAFAAGEYNPAKVLKFTLPYMILAILSCAVSATLFYPLG